MNNKTITICLSIITLNIKRLSVPIKRHKSVWMDKKMRPKCSLIGLDKDVVTYTMDYYSGIITKECLPFVTCMNLEGVMLSE